MILIQAHNVFFFFFLTALSRLTSISMNDPVYIQILEPSLSSQSPPSQQADSYAMPDRLQQYMVVVPSKLRLVCLAAFILARCKVTTDMHTLRFIMQLRVD